MPFDAECMCCCVCVAVCVCVCVCVCVNAGLMGFHVRVVHVTSSFMRFSKTRSVMHRHANTHTDTHTHRHTHTQCCHARQSRRWARRRANPPSVCSSSESSDLLVPKPGQTGPNQAKHLGQNPMLSYVVGFHF